MNVPILIILAYKTVLIRTKFVLKNVGVKWVFNVIGFTVEMPHC